MTAGHAKSAPGDTMKQLPECELPTNASVIALQGYRRRGPLRHLEREDLINKMYVPNTACGKRDEGGTTWSHTRGRGVQGDVPRSQPKPRLRRVRRTVYEGRNEARASRITADGDGGIEMRAALVTKYSKLYREGSNLDERVSPASGRRRRRRTEFDKGCKNGCAARQRNGIACETRVRSALLACNGAEAHENERLCGTPKGSAVVPTRPKPRVLQAACGRQDEDETMRTHVTVTAGCAPSVVQITRYLVAMGLWPNALYSRQDAEQGAAVRQMPGPPIIVVAGLPLLAAVAAS
ncbi:hypothetical protein B0H11DRAFT_1936672 [Mycena galericulata]|nr:hypothetical protein B0H11DRAFT_1936672 [Mycena galericulata]